MRKGLGLTILSFEQLSTLLYQVKAVVDSRRLTCVEADAEQPSFITPDDIIIGKQLPCLPAPSADSAMRYAGEDLKRRTAYRQWQSDYYRKSWKKENLLQFQSGDHVPRCATFKMEIGKLVIPHGYSKPRQLWKLGKVSEAYPGNDGIGRRFKVRQQDGLVTKMPIQRLYLLEASA